MRRFLVLIAPSLRSRFWLMLVLVAVPILALVGWLIARSYLNERRAMERQLIETSRALSALMESELRERIASLRGVAMMHAPVGGEEAVFCSLSRQVGLRPGEWIVRFDAEGRERGAAAEEEGRPHPQVTLTPECTQALDAGRVYVSNFVPAVPPRPAGVFVAIGIPSTEGPPGTLCLVMSSAALGEVLLRSRAMPQGVAAVLDREHTVLARNRSPDVFVGRKASADVQQAARTHFEGVRDSTTLDGHRSMVAVYVSRETGWAVVAAGHRSELLEPAMRMLLVAVGAAMLAAVCLVGLAVWFGRTTQRLVQQLVHDTQALAQGAAVPVRATGLRETDAVSAALAETARELAARQAALREARDAAVRASRAKDEFLASLSHELRTPLNPVLLLASDAAEDPRHPPEVRELFGEIEKNVLFEVRLIDDLLDITRIVAGRLTLRNGPLELDAAVAEVVARMRPLADAKPLAVQQQLAAGVSVVGDRVRLQQVFTNVLGNAVKFTPAGGTVWVRTRVVGGGVEVEITDTGIGLSTAELARVFDRFAQGDHGHGRSSPYGGLGLGLAIARSLVEAHGGRLEATSPGLGRGSTFRIWLPVHAGAGDAAPPEGAAERA